jgi:predicted helicase
VRYAYRPFDNRWLYWEPETKLLHEKRTEYFPHVGGDNLWIEARQRQTKANFDRGYVTSALADSFGAGCSSFFPAYLNPDAANVTLLNADAERASNLTRESSAYLDHVKANASALWPPSARTPTGS